MSPETDSGFMGSESSQLTAALHSPLHQRAVIRYDMHSLCGQLRLTFTQINDSSVIVCSPLCHARDCRLLVNL